MTVLFKEVTERVFVVRPGGGEEQGAVSGNARIGLAAVSTRIVR